LRTFELLLDFDARLPDIAKPTARITLEASGQQVANRARRRVRQARPIDLGAKHVRQRVRRRLALEQPAIRQHLEQHDPEGPHVGALVYHGAARLLGTHVGRRAEDDPGPRVRRAQRVGQALASDLTHR
jgi:hypothetical protein